MSTFNHPELASPTPHNLSSSENIRAIFFTNLILLGIQEYALQPTGIRPSSLDLPRGPSTSRHHNFQTPLESSRQQHLLQQPNHHQKHIVIAPCGSGSIISKPLELHRHVFAKGNQSTKALEFVLWFLFTRLDKAQARERFKECWPILDRHDAREFRNVAFKWLEELRKEGCFGIGHNLDHTGSQALGLGLFLPTIRRSYLDDSIGERIEQLVLILSTYVLSQAMANEMSHSQTLQRQGSTSDPALSARNIDRELIDLVAKTPESIREEETLLMSIDSNIIQQSKLFIREMEKQRDVRQVWSTTSSEMTGKLQDVTRNLARTETERRAFLARQPQLTERTSSLSLQELRILENCWIDKINNQWLPVLSFVECHVGRREVLQSLLDVDEGKGSSVLDGRSIQLDLPTTLKHLVDSGSIMIHRDSNPDLAAVLKIWKRSLQTLESSGARKDLDSETMAMKYVTSFEVLSKDHNQQLEGIQKLKKRLENRLKEASIRVERLQREQTIKHLPYRRLLSMIPDSDHGGVTGTSQSPDMELEERQDAFVDAEHIASLFAPASGNPRLLDIRNRVYESVHERHDQEPDCNQTLREVFDSKEASTILTFSQPPAATAPRERPIIPHRSLTGAGVLRRPLTIKSVSSSTIRPPASILARLTAKPSGQTIVAATHGTVMDSTRLTTRPVAEDLIMHVNSQDSSVVNESSFEEVMSLLTPTKPKAPASRLDLNLSYHRQVPSSSTQQTTMPLMRKSNFFTSIFDKNDMSTNMEAKSGATRDTLLLDDNAHVARPRSQEVTLATDSTKPSSPALTRSIFRQHFGVSRKRNQSSDFQPESVAPSLFRTEQVHQIIDDEEIIQQSGINKAFNADTDDLPGTPSKRRRVDPAEEQFVRRSPSFEFDIEVSLNDDDTTYRSGVMSSPSSHTPSFSPKKAAFSPKLTIDDLRTLTPKHLRTGGSNDKAAMPLMLLHTPQQRRLFGMESDLDTEPAPPFPALTPPSTSDTELVRRAMTSKASPSRSQFSSSIFSQFRTRMSLETSRNMISLNDDQSGDMAEASPFIVSSDAMNTTKSPVNPLVNRKLPQAPTTSSIVNHLLTRNSAIQDRVCNQETQQTEPAAPTVTESNSRNVETTNGNGTINITSTTPEFQKDREDQRMLAYESPATIPAVDFKASRNPWGRPPSWKPKSPRMVDIEKRRQADRAHRLAASSIKPMALPLESLESFRASIYGRASISVPSSSSISFTSSSSASSRSVCSESGHLANNFGGVASEVHHDDAEFEAKDDDDSQ
ncbi:hypothetical protein BGZ65_011924, partial [Modicella reniformis]